MSDLLVKVEGVSKKFCKNLKRSMLYGLQDIAKNMIGVPLNSDNLRSEEFWSVDNVSFEIRRGECLGLIGPNGSGKSTLLKILNGIISPDRGRVEIRGRVGALIEIGASFHPMLTGRENIYISGSTLGFRKREIDKKFDDILEFSELADFIDTPVKYYSSGMYVRLGFAIAAQMEPDVLLIDEVLAVGDVGFRAKCFNAINEIAKNAAVIFVSHAMPQVARVALDIMVMGAGKSIYYGKDVPLGIERYYDLFESEKIIISGSNKVKLHAINLYSNDENKKEKEPKIKYLDDLVVELAFSLDRTVRRCHIHIAFFDRELRNIAQFASMTTGYEFVNNGGILHVRAWIPKITFAPGRYTVTVGFKEAGVANDEWGEILGRYQAVKALKVVGSVMPMHAPILLDGAWGIEVPKTH